MNMVSKEKLKDYFSKIPKTLIVFILILTCTTITILKMRKTVTVTIDNKDTEITTLSSNLSTVLSENNISLGEKDWISVPADSKIKNGDKINIKKAINVALSVDGKQLNVKTVKNTVGDVLTEQDVKLNKLDKISPEIDSKIKEGLNVSITRVEEKILENKQKVDFSKEVKKTDDYEKGTEKIVQDGKHGEKLISTKVVYEDGKEVSRKVVEEKIIKKPINQILAVGTKMMIKPRNSRGSKQGSPMGYSKKISLTATAYTADFNHLGVRDDPYAGMTASGNRAKRNPNGYSTIAVDPTVIPLGTKVYVEGYGLAVAEDTGGAIKGNKIDLFMDTYAQTQQWGVRTVNLYILN
ncbi:3D domain-containing protein [Hathewaya histolytica]|uniref:3D domain-containing protein n=1 Tax=Hathewaya histolytica TaxID=1498 RepID=UPI003B674F10